MDRARGDSSQLTGDPSGLLAALVASSFDAIISKDLNSVIVSWNPAAERMFGYTAAEAVGRSILILIPENRHGEESEIIGRVRRGERVDTFETVRRRKDGTLIEVSITVSPIRGGDGTIIGASKIARDITVKKENERKIRLLMREVNHRVKNQFAVVLSMIRETERRSTEVGEFADSIRGRIMALARSQDLLVHADWSGASMAELVRDHLAPFNHEDRITVRGPDLSVGPNAVQHLGMALHELGTNSFKYGALAASTGHVLVEWSLARDETGEPTLLVVWDERFPPRISPNIAGRRRTGFGSLVLRRATPLALSGKASLNLEDSSLRWTLTAPVRELLSSQAQ